MLSKNKFLQQDQSETQPLNEKYPFTPQKQQQSQVQQQQYGTSIFQEKDELKEPPQVTTVMTHKDYFNDSQYRRCYPMTSNYFHTIKSVVTCQDKNLTYVDMINKAGDLKFLEEDKKTFQNKILKLIIHETSGLELDPNLVHPFVKVHFIEYEKGTYIKKLDRKKNSVSRGESLTYYDNSKNEYISAYCDFILPVATNCCDLRIHGNSKAQWNETIYINEDILQLFQTNTIMLFEILDFNVKMLKDRDFQNLDLDNQYRVAWGYLRPIGLSKNHVGQLKIQLYKYYFNSQRLQSKDRKSIVPLVYFDFLYPEKEEYKGYLTISIFPINRPNEINVMRMSKNFFEKEYDGFAEGLLTKKLKELDKDDKEIEEQVSEQDMKKARRRYVKGEACQIPDKVLAKFQSGQLGCMRLCFSNKGNLLAAACTNKDSKTVIKIFDVDEQIKQVYQFRGHRNIIHQLSWSNDDQFLVSCSSDFSAKVWSVPPPSLSGQGLEIDEYDSETECQVATLNHPSYVYSAVFHPKKRQEKFLVIATACFDAKVRIWYVNENERGHIPEQCNGAFIISKELVKYDEFDNLLEHRHPNIVEFDEKGKMFVGDSLGMIHIYDISSVAEDIRYVERSRVIDDNELQGDPINCISFCKIKKDFIVVHSRDNCIRSIEINSSGHKIIQRYYGSMSSKFPIHSKLSTDNQYIIAGSEDGKPHLWEFTSGIQMHIDSLEYQIDGSVSDVSWNKCYHMLAISGFGDEFPIIVYYWEKDSDFTSQEYKVLMEKLKKQEQEVEQVDVGEENEGNAYNVYNPGQYLKRPFKSK